MAQFIGPSKTFPICDAVIYRSPILETVITPIPDGQDKPVLGGPAEEMREILRQLDEILTQHRLTRRHVVSVQLFLQNVNRDIAAVNEVYRDFFSTHTPSRCAVGTDLQVDMLVEAIFRIEYPQELSEPK
jgi:enamine deaminase RidA (YjgF/YER057c/UK114 family)